MSWLARSIANTLKLDSDDEEEENDHLSASMRDHSTDTSNEESIPENQQSGDPSSPVSPSRGVREDLSEITKTLSRQFWGVASFLAPPPQSEPGESLNEYQSNTGGELDLNKERSGTVGQVGIRNDFAELGGKFRSGISKLSSNMAVSEFTKIASNILQLGSDEEEDGSYRKGAVGVTEEVVIFARDIAMHPETWLDFPLLENEEDEDFDMSDAQQDHALAVEHLAPRLAALRIELCPVHMSETHFWMIYFILVQPRLDKDDAQLLSTPQIAKARASLGQVLRKRTKESQLDQSNEFSNEEFLHVPPGIAPKNSVQVIAGLESTSSSAAVSNSDAEKHSVAEDGHGSEAKFRTLPSTNLNIENEGEDDDADDWLKEETSEIQTGAKTTIHMENEDDVSFSDLEDEDDNDMAISYKKERNGSNKESPDWVQLKKSSDGDGNSVNVEKVNVRAIENKESNDWLDVDDIEVA
ncbi:unnamed protein product [Cuscuta epithymum]|uniref:BSD domain-containing protein n=1 Tax=Cuscuta epithymum TaxID=186058 RepID=A0AAV0DVP3_9ASTE|nr:unnamed protein product [Cuscuta epithymum]